MAKKSFTDIGRKYKVSSDYYTELSTGNYVVWSTSSGACVVCPNCNKLGVVTNIVTSNENTYQFKCHSCVKRTEVPRYKSEYIVKAKCEPCATYFRTTVEENLEQFKVLRVNCPRCDTLANSATVQKIRPVQVSYCQEIIQGRERYTGYPLYFLDYLDGEPIWALNREHLDYLINYIEADLRKEPHGKYGQSWAIPKFMKLAKNRNRVLKVLKRLHKK